MNKTTGARWMMVAALFAAAGCSKAEDEEPMTLAEVSDALTDSSASTEAGQLASGTIELTTDFTIGDAVQKAAENIRGFIGAQLPCADIQLVDATLTVEYGAKPGNCTYRGQTYSGKHSITVERNDVGDVVVQHAWTDLKNQRVSVTGTATVTWSLAEGERRVVHDLTWSRFGLAGQTTRTWHGTGDRTQRPHSTGGLAVGIETDGTRTWEREGGRGLWSLDIDHVQVRWTDPVPESGQYLLQNPEGKSLTFAFERQDEDSIRVRVSSANKEFTLIISKLGVITEAG